MNRRKFIGAAGSTALVTSLAGCSEAFGQSEDDFAGRGDASTGGLIAEEVDTAPSDATVVDATTGRIGSVEPIQDVIENAAGSDQSPALLPLNDEETINEVQSALRTLPYYDGDSKHGYYLGYNQSVILLYQYYRRRGDK